MTPPPAPAAAVLVQLEACSQAIERIRQTMHALQLQQLTPMEEAAALRMATADFEAALDTIGASMVLLAGWGVSLEVGQRTHQN